MSTPLTKVGYDRVAPLSDAERAQVDRAGRRLHSALGEFVAALPEEARNASGMARHLEIDRTTCQRVVFVTSRPYTGVEVIERLPGVRALRALARAARPGVDRSQLASLDAAIGHFDEVVSALAGSLTKLCKRIATEPDVVRPAARAGSDARVRLFDAAHEITGRASDCWVAVYVYRPLPDEPDVVEVIRAHGLRGHTSRADAFPLVIKDFSTRDAKFTGLGADAGESSTVLLDAFTSDPKPLVTTRQPGQFLVQGIDTPASATERPIDLMLASRTTVPHPTTCDPAVEEVWALVNFPCRHLLLDVYLHPDLARRSLPSLDAHLWGPDFQQGVSDRWQTRTNETNTLQVLGAGARAGSPEAYPRLGELTAELFERSGLDRSSYVGFRCDVAYPLWRVGYCVTFDFRETAG